MTETTSICRLCHASCGIQVTIEAGRIVPSTIHFGEDPRWLYR
jgi:hypothetical protein